MFKLRRQSLIIHICIIRDYINYFLIFLKHWHFLRNHWVVMCRYKTAVLMIWKLWNFADVWLIAVMWHILELFKFEIAGVLWNSNIVNFNFLFRIQNIWQMLFVRSVDAAENAAAFFVCTHHLIKLMSHSNNLLLLLSHKLILLLQNFLHSNKLIFEFFYLGFVCFIF